MMLHMVRVGTSAFHAKGWEKTFYPGLRGCDYLTYYSEHFDKAVGEVQRTRVAASAGAGE
jgi:uncharacterized protein YecE (DUF72 family)